MPKIATTAVILDKDKILIGRRARDDRWELPGGKVDPGESPGECVRREIREELGLEVRIEKSLGTLEGVYRDIPMVVHAFVTVSDGREAVPNVHRELRWIEPGEADGFDIVEEDRLVLERFRGEAD